MSSLGRTLTITIFFSLALAAQSWAGQLDLKKDKPLRYPASVAGNNSFSGMMLVSRDTQGTLTRAGYNGKVTAVHMPNGIITSDISMAMYGKENAGRRPMEISLTTDPNLVKAWNGGKKLSDGSTTNPMPEKRDIEISFPPEVNPALFFKEVMQASKGQLILRVNPEVDESSNTSKFSRLRRAAGGVYQGNYDYSEIQVIDSHSGEVKYSSLADWWEKRRNGLTQGTSPAEESDGKYATEPSGESKTFSAGAT